MLTWNGRELLDMVLGSIARQDLGSFRTIVVDNGSTDGTVEIVRRRWPDVEVVELGANLGITTGLNRCVEAARGSDLVALVNQDVELDPAWLSTLTAALQAAPRAASASGKVLSYHRPELIDRAGDVMAWTGEAVGRGAGEVDRGQYEEPAEVFCACAGVGLFRMRAFEHVGPFDDDFSAYHEDTDWGFRARLAGWTSIYVPGAPARHVGGASAGHQSEFALYHGMRNGLWTIAKNYPAWSLAVHAPDLLRRHALMAFYVTRGRLLPVLLRAWGDAVRGLPRVLRKRRRVQRLATVDRRTLEAALPRRLPS